MSTCYICSCTFTARHAYGLCPTCFNKDAARELDRIVTATHKARKSGLITTLSLKEWLSTLSDSNGMCSFCNEYPCSYIEMVEPARGLTYDNVVVSCRACHKRRDEGYNTAEHRVKQYLGTERTPHSTLQNEEDTTC